MDGILEGNVDTVGSIRDPLYKPFKQLNQEVVTVFKEERNLIGLVATDKLRLGDIKDKGITSEAN